MKTLSLISVLLILLIGSSIKLGYTLGWNKQLSSNAASEIKTAVVGTGSMLPLIQPDNLLNLTKFSGEPLCGHVYIYNASDASWTNNTIVHRFLYETQNGTIYFKGDNNANYDPGTTKDKILYEVNSIILTP